MYGPRAVLAGQLRRPPGNEVTNPPQQVLVNDFVRRRATRSRTRRAWGQRNALSEAPFINLEVNEMGMACRAWGQRNARRRGIDASRVGLQLA